MQLLPPYIVVVKKEIMVLHCEDSIFLGLFTSSLKRREIKKSRCRRGGGAGTPVALSGSFHSRPTTSAPKTTTLVKNDLDIY